MKRTHIGDRLYTVWADVAKAMASPKRVELLDLLAQAERPVEALARATGLTITNTSSHLAVLRTARLVETRREAQFVHYRLADDGVIALLRAVQAVARRRLHEADHLVRTYIDGRDPFEPIGAAELWRRLEMGEVTVIDVRPAAEYEAGHIGGALSIPLEAFETRVGECPTDRPVVAYCRGPYCIAAVDAVERLRARGLDARRLDAGLPDWRLAGYPVVRGDGPDSAIRSRPASGERAS